LTHTLSLQKPLATEAAIPQFTRLAGGQFIDSPPPAQLIFATTQQPPIIERSKDSFQPHPLGEFCMSFLIFKKLKFVYALY
jgi:hypothetical protein